MCIARHSCFPSRGHGRVSPRFLGLSIALCAGLGAARIHAATQEFYFKDPKAVNSVTFVLDSPLEPILGMASGISGVVRYDPAAPQKVNGWIQVDATTLHVANPKMKEMLHSPDWMDVEKYPTIELRTKEARSLVGLADGASEVRMTAELTCRGITREIPVVVRTSYQQGRLGERLQGRTGDLLVLRSTFQIQRRDFGIKPDMGGQVVADTIEVQVAIVGIAPKPE